MIRQSQGRILLIAIVVLMYGIFSVGQDRDTDSAAREVRQFATKFYDWYRKVAVDTDQIKILATQEMRRALALDLLQALKTDYEAQARDTDYIVGIDFDPFLAAQDPCDRYEVRKVVKRGTSYWAEIYGVGGCKPHNQPDLNAEVVFRNGAWVFTNFHYPGPVAQDLLSLLRRLRHNRMKR